MTPALNYFAYVTKKGRRTIVVFPDCPGCQTITRRENFAGVARRALERWLAARLVNGHLPPRPTEHAGAPDGQTLARVPVRPDLAAALEIRWARHDAGLTQRDLGKRAGITQQQIARLEKSGENTSLKTLTRLGLALGLEVIVGFERVPRVPTSDRSAWSAIVAAARKLRTRVEAKTFEPTDVVALARAILVLDAMSQPDGDECDGPKSERETSPDS